MAAKSGIFFTAIVFAYMPIITGQADLMLPSPVATLDEPVLTQMPEPTMTVPLKSTAIPQPTVTVAPEPPAIDKSTTNIAPLERFLPPSAPQSSGMSNIQNKNKLKPNPKSISPSYIEPALIPPKIEIPTSPPPDSIFKRDKHGDDDWGPQPSCTKSPCN